MVTTDRRRRRSGRTRRVRAGRVLGWFLIAGVAVVGVAGVWTAVDAVRVREQLLEAARVVPLLEDQVLAGDDEAVESSVATLRVAAVEAERTTTRPHWRLLSWLPGTGSNVRAVQTLASTVADLAEGPLPDLPEVVGVASPAALAPQDGRVDVARIAQAAPTVVAADDAVTAAIADLAGIDRNALLPQVRDAVDTLSEELHDLSRSTATASRTAALLPAMLGIDGPREYLVLVQNNAEPRALGGIVGSVLLLRVDDGAIELVEQVAGNSVSFAEPVGELSSSETSLFGTQLGRYLLNVTSTPDFPRAAALASEMWTAERGEVVDGVMAIDPVMLGEILSATGPVTTPSGVTLDDSGAANYLLNQIYLDEPDPSRQDVFFAEAAAAMFNALSDPAGDPRAAVDALVDAADSGRLMLWSADETEQDLIAPTTLAGALPRDEAAQVVGVYLNDGSGAKVGYYLDLGTDLTVLECRPDGSQRLRLTVDLSSQVPDVATLPAYLTGGGAFVPEGTIRTNVAVYAPAGGKVVEVVGPGGELPVLTQRHDGLQVSQLTATLAPGEALRFEVEMLTSRHLGSAPSLRTTPGPRPDSSVVELGCAAG